MNNFDDKTPVEFDELLEALWAGGLDRDGEARLEALAASDPALAERLRRERALSAMLAGHGPNRAPKGLAEAVFARLDAEAPQTKAERPRARVITIPAWFTPTIRWGLAAAVIVVCFTQLMYLIVNDRMGGQTLQLAYEVAPLPNPKTTDKSNLASYVPPKPTVKPELAKKAETKIAAPEDKLMAAVRTPSPTPKAQAAEIPAAAPVEKELAKVIDSSAKTTESKAIASVLPADAKPEAAALQEGNDEAIAAPGKGVLHGKALQQPSSRAVQELPRQRAITGKNAGVPVQATPAEDKVILRIILPEQPETAGSVELAQRAAEPRPGVRGLRIGSELNGGGLKGFAAGGPPASVRVQPPAAGRRSTMAAPAPAAQPARHELTHVQIEQIVATCGGSVKSVQQVRAVPAIWRIDGSIPQANMAALIARLGQLGIKAGPAENAQPSQYAILQGEELLRGKTETTTGTQRLTGRKSHQNAIPLTVLVDEGRR